MSGNAIEATGLVKRYGAITAVGGVSMRVPTSSIYALLGPNGAGKTTLLGMLTTLIVPDEGAARVAGYDAVREADAVRKRIGVTFQDIVLDNDLTGRQVLDVHGQLYRQPAAERKRRAADLIALVQLEDAIDRRVKTYSGGMKRRLELARGLMTDPQVLFLDEPTQGLDPQNRVSIWDYLRRLNVEHGLTILLTTHYMDEAEALASHVGIIDHGAMVAEGVPDALVSALGADVIRIVGQGDASHSIGALEALPFVERVQLGQATGSLQVYVDSGNRRLADVVIAAGSNDFHIDDISLSRPTLGDVFLQHTGRALRD
ncbi:MAG: ATP-binding cassette domain-containing protein, partial [Chloroflexales bacterium]|nr:ATP-binding cassette domain-containing protein [Chloroflexales bacterium]